jgi:DNA-binding MarR family transcriptional regulator
MELRSLRGRLGLDSGYLTRAMQSLEREGLIRVSVCWFEKTLGTTSA